MTDDTYQKRIAFKLLEDLKEMFYNQVNEKMQKNSTNLQQLLKNELKKFYDLYNTDQCDKLLEVKSNVEATKE